MNEQRRPRAVRIEDPGAAIVTVRTPPEPAPAPPPARRGGGLWSRLAGAALAGLVSLGLGLALADLIERAFALAPALGWVAIALAAAFVVAVVALVVRELSALGRLSAIDGLKDTAARAHGADDRAAAETLARHVDRITADRPELAQARIELAAARGRPIGGRDLATLTETTLLAPLDRAAVAITMDSARRIAVLTALSPRAVFDVVAVVIESARLIRRLSEHYGARPGRLGMIALGRRVAGHILLTGGLAAGDELLSQVFGAGLAARVSAKLGEGLANGLMTARIGLAAIDLVRPMPFIAAERPKLQDVAAEIAKTATG